MDRGGQKIRFKLFRVYFVLQKDNLIPFIVSKDQRTFVTDGPFGIKKNDILLRINKKANLRYVTFLS